MAIRKTTHYAYSTLKNIWKPILDLYFYQHSSKIVLFLRWCRTLFFVKLLHLYFAPIRAIVLTHYNVCPIQVFIKTCLMRYVFVNVWLCEIAKKLFLLFFVDGRIGAALGQEITRAFPKAINFEHSCDKFIYQAWYRLLELNLGLLKVCVSGDTFH